MTSRRSLLHARESATVDCDISTYQRFHDGANEDCNTCVNTFFCEWCNPSNGRAQYCFSPSLSTCTGHEGGADGGVCDNATAGESSSPPPSVSHAISISDTWIVLIGLGLGAVGCVCGSTSLHIRAISYGVPVAAMCLPLYGPEI